MLKNASILWIHCEASRSKNLRFYQNDLSVFLWVFRTVLWEKFCIYYGSKIHEKSIKTEHRAFLNCTGEKEEKSKNPIKSGEFNFEIRDFGCQKVLMKWRPKCQKSLSIIYPLHGGPVFCSWLQRSHAIKANQIKVSSTFFGLIWLQIASLLWIQRTS